MARLNVAVTGGSGKIGIEAIKALTAAGHRAANFDIRRPASGERMTVADFADFGQCLGALSGVDTVGGRFDAVLHLAGIPAPGLATDHEIFQNNTMSTYNVFSACRRLGIRKVVWASSETLLGLPFTTPPDFAPLDETHPLRPEWSYSLSKRLGETLADEFARWDPNASIISLRFSNVYDAKDYAQVAAIRARPELRRGNLWAYVDARDCGEACRLALEADLPGHTPLIIAAADSIVETPSAELLAQHFPGTPIRGAFEANQSFLSIEKAARLIGYRAKYSWRDQV